MLCGGVLAAGLIYSGSHVHAAADQPAALYSAAQATKGADLYQSKQCGLCHGASLAGQGSVPALTGDHFATVYAGKPVATLFDKVQNQMPPMNPGSLSADETASIVAYILSKNQYPAGSADLPSDHDKLTALQLPKSGN